MRVRDDDSLLCEIAHIKRLNFSNLVKCKRKLRDEEGIQLVKNQEKIRDSTS